MVKVAALETEKRHNGYSSSLLQKNHSQRVRLTNDLDDLSTIQNAGRALVVCQRVLPREVQEWLNALDAESLPVGRFEVSPADFRSAAEKLLDGRGIPATVSRKFLIGDMIRLVQVFAKICQVERVDARIEKINTDSCWKFHRDNVKLRLLTTYRGPATEWVSAEHAEAALLAQRDFSGPIQKLSCGDIAIFKGNQAIKSDGVVHRSPLILGTGTSRLLLCLNTPQ
jgi:hypothetical protein